jgi:glucose-1-phosphate thymidylyltransferase
MKCILLCAGYATRLYPLTENQPKALLAVGEQTILGHIMDRVEQVDEIDEVYIITNDRFVDNFTSWKNSYGPKKKVVVISDGTSSNDERLGAVGDIKFLLDHQEVNDDLLIVAGDNLFEFSLKELTSFFKEKGASVVALYDIQDKQKAAGKYGIVETDGEGKFVGFEEKPEQPKTSLVSTGCYVLTRAALQKFHTYSEDSTKNDNPGDFIKWLSEQEAVYGFTFSERWFDIGSFEALEEAYEAHKDKVETVE